MKNDLLATTFYLVEIAENRCYYEPALQRAKELVKDKEDIDLLNRYLQGNTKSTDHIALQDLAIKLRKMYMKKFVISETNLWNNTASLKIVEAENEYEAALDALSSKLEEDVRDSTFETSLNDVEDIKSYYLDLEHIFGIIEIE